MNFQIRRDARAHLSPPAPQFPFEISNPKYQIVFLSPHRSPNRTAQITTRHSKQISNSVFISVHPWLNRIRDMNVIDDPRQVIFPNALATTIRGRMRNRRAFPMSLGQLVSTVLHFAQMPQLRRNGRFAIPSERPQFPERQPHVAIRSGQHHIANHLTLRPQAPRIIFPLLRRNALVDSGWKLGNNSRSLRRGTAGVLVPCRFPESPHNIQSGLHPYPPLFSL
jgi:hypothetical protein